MYNTSVQENGGDESAHKYIRYIRLLKNSAWFLPPPLVWVFIMETTISANSFQRTQLRCRVGSVVETYKAKLGWVTDTHANDIHGSWLLGVRSVTSFMHGGNRAPALIRAYDEGPNIGFTTGYQKTYCYWRHWLQKTYIPWTIEDFPGSSRWVWVHRWTPRALLMIESTLITDHKLISVIEARN